MTTAASGRTRGPDNDSWIRRLMRDLRQALRQLGIGGVRDHRDCVPDLVWNQADVALLLVDDNGKIIDLNNGVRNFLGYPDSDSLKGRWVGELVLERNELTTDSANGLICHWRHFGGHTIRLQAWGSQTAGRQMLYLLRPAFAIPPGEIGDTRQWHLLMDMMPNLVYVYDIHDGRNVLANRPLGDLFGYGPDALETLGSLLIPLLVHPDDYPQVKAMRRRLHDMADSDGAIEIAFRIHHKSGSYRWVSCRERVFSLTTTGRCREAIGCVQEISTLGIPHGAVVHGKDGTSAPIPVNHATLLGVLPVAAVTSEQASDVPSATGAMTPDSVDTTTRRENAAAPADATFSTLRMPAEIGEWFQNAPAGMSLANGDCRYIYCNAFFAAICGMPASDILGRTVAETFPGRWPEMELFYKLVRDTGTPVTHVEMQLPAPYGEDTTEGTGKRTRFYDVSYFPLLIAAQAPYGVGVMMHDITARKQMEQELKAQKVQAEEASHVREQFLAVLSHELRTPMTPVLLAAKVMESEEGVPPALRSRLAMIRRNVELEVRLIDDLLDLTRLAHRRLAAGTDVVNIHDMIYQVADIYLVQIRGKRQTLKFDMNASRVFVRGDAPRLQQILWNLVSNSVKFTPNGGEIVIRTANDNADRIVIEISDNGVGIDPNVIPHIFDAFTQGESGMHRRYGGLGLGLAISLALSELHGGTLSASSIGIGHGATFTLTFPAMSAPPRLPAPSNTVRQPKAAARIRVLLVEDHLDSAEMIAATLRDRDWLVVIAQSVASALDIASRQQFDVLISDLGLPDGSGYTLLKLLRERGLYFPAIALSGYSDVNDFLNSQRAGFAEHLVKPIGGEHVEEVVSKLLLDT